MPSIIDLITQGQFNGMFNPAPQSSSDPAKLQALIAALQQKVKPGSMPAMPTTTAPNNITMAQPPAPPMTGMGGPAGGPEPPQMPMQPPMQPQGQMPPQQPPQGGFKGFMNGPKGDALMGMLAGWAQGGTIGQSLGQGGIGAMQGVKEGKKNKTLQMFLDQSNLDPALKGLLTDNPDLAKAFIAEKFKGGGDQTAEIKNWQFAQQHPDFAKMIGNQGGSMFGTPVPYTKPDGSVGYALTSRNGDVVDMQAPGGGSFLGPGGVAAAKSKGDATGTASFNLPSVERAIGVLQSNITKLQSEPGLERVTGLYGANTPNVTGAARRAQSYVDQVLGGTFLSAYNDLRGAGAITESEGAKAVDAYNRLRSTNMDTEDYRTALRDFNEQLNTMLDVARQKAGMGNAPAGQSPAAGGWSVQQVQ